MGSIMSAIADDIDDYLYLCKKFNEKPVYSHGSPDCYGAHAQKLEKRAAEERKANGLKKK